MRYAVLAFALLTASPAAAGSRADRLMLAHKDPIARFVAVGSVDSVADCIHAALFAVRPAVEQIPDGQGRIVRVRNLGNTQIIVRVEPDPRGARVDYRARSRFGNGKFTDAVMSCK